MNSARKSCLYTHFFVHFDQIKIILTLFWSFWWTFVLFVARFVARIGETLDFFEEALWRQKLRTPWKQKSPSSNRVNNNLCPFFTDGWKVGWKSTICYFQSQ